MDAFPKAVKLKMKFLKKKDLAMRMPGQSANPIAAKR